MTPSRYVESFENQIWNTRTIFSRIEIERTLISSRIYIRGIIIWKKLPEIINSRRQISSGSYKRLTTEPSFRGRSTSRTVHLLHNDGRSTHYKVNHNSSLCFALHWMKGYQGSISEITFLFFFYYTVSTESNNDSTCTYQNERHFCGHFLRRREQMWAVLFHRVCSLNVIEHWSSAKCNSCWLVETMRSSYASVWNPIRKTKSLLKIATKVPRSFNPQFGSLTRLAPSRPRVNDSEKTHRRPRRWIRL